MDNIKISRFIKLDVVIASLLMFSPLILISITGEIRTSISNYAYSKTPNIFSGLIYLSAFMFMYNSVINNKFYNIILCFALIGIVLTPHKDFTNAHNFFALVFFSWSVFVMVYYSSKKQRWFKIIAGLIVIISLLGYFIEFYSLLYAEWLGLVPICLHHIGEALNKID